MPARTGISVQQGNVSIVKNINHMGQDLGNTGGVRHNSYFSFCKNAVTIVEV